MYTTLNPTNSFSRGWNCSPRRECHWLARSQWIGQEVWKNAHISRFLPVSTLFTAPHSVYMWVYVFVWLVWRKYLHTLLSITWGPKAFKGAVSTGACTHPSILSNTVTADVVLWYHVPLPPDSHEEYSVSYLSAAQLLHWPDSSIPPSLIISPSFSFPYNTHEQVSMAEIGKIAQFSGPTSSLPLLRLA